MAAMAWRKSPPELVALFDAAVPDDRHVERRKMFGYPAAFVNGKLFAGLYQESVVLKLAGADREELRRAHGAQSFEPRPGRRMGEFMVLPPAVVADPAGFDAWLARSLAYVAALSATTPKRKKTARRKARA